MQQEITTDNQMIQLFYTLEYLVAIKFIITY